MTRTTRFSTPIYLLILLLTCDIHSVTSIKSVLFSNSLPYKERVREYKERKKQALEEISLVGNNIGDIA